METEKAIMQGTNEDPKLMESDTIAVAQANADNIKKLMENEYQCKEKMIRMKDTLVKERGEGQEIKRKHEASLSEFERLQKAYQALE